MMTSLMALFATLQAINQIHLRQDKGKILNEDYNMLKLSELLNHKAKSIQNKSTMLILKGIH